MEKAKTFSEYLERNPSSGKKETGTRRKTKSFSEYQTYRDLSDGRLNDDLETLNRSLTDLDSGWKDARSLADTKDRLSGIVSRLSSAKQYGIDHDAGEEYLKSVDDAYKAYAEILENFGNVQDYYAQFASEEDYDKRVRRGKELYDGATGAEDFGEYSGIGAAIPNPSMKEAEGSVVLFGQRIGGKDIGNIVTYSIDNNKELRLGAANGSKLLGDLRYSNLKEDEISVYNYWLAKENAGQAEKGTAQAYLASLDDTLNRREAGELSDRIEGNLGLELVFGFSTGLSQFANGVKNAFNFGDEYIAPSMEAYASQKVREGLSDRGGEFLGSSLGQIGYDTVSTIGNMFPTILLSAVTGGTAGSVLGVSAMGLSSAGNTYQELLNSGMNKGLARALSTVLGAWEGASEYYLGRIEGLSSGWTTKALGKTKLVKGLQSSANGLTRAMFRFFDQFVIDPAQEGLEEVIQDIGSTVIKAIFTGEWEWSTAEEQAYNFTLGALSAACMNAPTNIVGNAINDITTYRQGKNIMDLGGVDALKNLATETAKERGETSTLGRYAENVAKKPTPTNVGILDRKISEAKNENNRRGLEKALIDQMTKDGVGAKRAKRAAAKFAEILLEDYNGGEVDLGRALKNPSVKAVYDKFVKDENSEIAKRDARHTEVREGIIRDYVDGKIAKAEMDKTLSEKYSFSDSGETVDIRTGEKITPAKDAPVASNKDGNLILNLENGGTVRASDISFSSKGEAVLYSVIADMGVGTDTANALISSAIGADGKNRISVAFGLRDAYWYGAKGVSAAELARGVFTSKLTEAARKTAYNLGKTDAIYTSSRKTVTANLKQNTYEGEYRIDDGKIADTKFKNLNDRQKSGLSLAKILSKLGANVYVFETTLQERQSGKENGSYLSADGSIHIDLNSGSVKGEGLVAYTVAHEFTHFIEDFSREKFKKYADLLFEELGKDKKSVSAMLTEEVERLRSQENAGNLGENALRDLAYSEVVAKCSEKIFTDTDALARIADRLAKTDRTLLQKIVDFFKIIIGRLRGDYKGQKANSALGEEAADTIRRVEAIRDIFADAAVDALQNFRKAESNIKSAPASAIRYSERSFSSQIDDVLSGVDTNSTHLKLSETPKLLLEAGLPRLPILMTAKHLKKIVSADGHRIDVDVVKKIPEYISAPVMIADSLTRTDSIVIVTEVIDAEKRPIIAAIMLNGVGRWNKAHINANIMTSAYGRNNFQSFLNRLAESGAVLYWDKKKSQDLSVSLGVQFPNAITNLDSDTIIRKASAFVNSENMEFSETLKRRSTQTSERAALIADGYSKNASTDSISENSENVNRESEKSFSKFSEREDLSNRTLLANALETVAKNETERQKLNEYKTKIGLMEQEEERLSRTRAKIKELSFAKGARDTEKIRSLQSTASEIETRITKYDRQLFRMEASEALRNVLTREVERTKRTEAKKYVEAMNKYRQKTAETVNEIVKQNRESRKNAIEGRNKTEARARVRKIVDELNTYLRENKVLIGMQKVVAEALDAVNMDTVGAEERVAKYDELIAKTSDPAMIEELTATRNRIAAQGENLQGKLQKLKAAYADIINSDDPLIANSHDEVIEGKLDDVIREVGDTPIRNMTIAQLEEVYDLYKMILTSVRQANRAFRLDRAKTIDRYAAEVMEEVEKTRGTRGKVSKASEFLRKNFGWDNLKPIYAMRMIGSDTLTELYKNVRDGQSVWYKDFSAARDFLREQKSKYGVSDWDFGEKHTFSSESGKSFDMTLEQILSLYAYSKRPQAIDHLTKGGIVFDDAVEVVEKNKLGIPVKYAVNDKSAYRLSEATIAEILHTLTEEQKAYADTMQKYLAEVMGEKGNEVSLALYGVKLFKEENYFPLKSSGQFLYSENEVRGEAKIKNAGFTKATVSHANNPIIMSNFTDVWVGHCNEMSMYHAFTLPLEDFNRVWQYKARGESEDTSVRTVLSNACGDAANTYIKDLLVELNGGVRVKDAGVLDKLTGLAKKGAVLASASVTIQQPSAICRAMAYISPKYFLKTALGQLNFRQHSATWEECKKYAPIAGIKEMGYFDTGMGRSSLEWAKAEEYDGFRNKLKAFFKDGAYRDEVLSKAPALADEITWCHIWNATKAWVSDTTSLVGEDFLSEAGKRFTEVIDLTQVYDSVLSRSANMRNKNSLMKMATAFMAEPTTTANMVLDAFVRGKRVGGAKGAKIVSETVGAVTASIVLNSLLKAVVYAWRDDDDEKSYLEKYGESAVDSFLDDINPFNYIPVLKDIVSLFQGYDVSRLDMSLFEDLLRALRSIDSSKKSAYQKVADILGAISSFFGIPLRNIERDLRPLIKKIIEAFG